jgi:hypothetical protein
MYFCLPNIINILYIQKLREMVPPPSQNSVGVCNQAILLILYYISSRVVTLLRVNDAHIEVLLLVSSSSILAFRYSLFLFVKWLLASRLTLFRLSINYFGLDPGTIAF